MLCLFFFFFLPLAVMFAAFALRRYTDRVTGLSTNHSHLVTAEDSDWTKVTDVWPACGQTLTSWRTGVIQRPDRDASWVKCVLFFRGGGQLWKQKCRTAGKQRSHHSVKLDTDLNKLIRHSRFKDSCCPHAKPVSVVFNSCIETSLNTQCSHIAH